MVPMNTAAIEDLYRRHHADLLRYARRLTRNPAIAEDVAQQAWIKFLDAHRGGTPWPEQDIELRALLFTVVRNVFIDGYRRAHFETRTLRLEPRQLDHAAGADPRPDCPPEAAAHQQGVARILQRGLSALPQAQREAVLLWQLGLDIPTMARCARVPRDTLLSRKKYAFARLKEYLASAGLRPESC
jgi:RNA polymerase sigma-70 factor (ECF subfamily)